VPTIGGWYALRAGVPTQAMADRMAEVLATPEWNTPLPVCTVERHGPHYINSNAFHGGVWPSQNYPVADGLARYGHHDLAAEFCDKIIDNAMTRGLNEHYHCDTGEPLGVPDLNMSCTLITMMLDGLSRKFVLKPKH
jgi:glycogen debranching enzyme